MSTLSPGFAQSPLHKAMLNIGCLFDITSGIFLRGKYGEMILNGGIANLTGIAGKGNSFKSTLMHYMMTQAMIRISPESTGSLYDTELNMHEWRVRAFHDILMIMADIKDGTNFFDQNRMSITDKTMHTGDEWYDILRTWLIQKRKDSKSLMRDTPFLDRDGETLMKMIVPTYTGIDSFSQFITSNAMKLQDENSIGESGTNMLNMNQGRAKAQFLMEIPALAQGAYNYIFMTVHIGDEFNLDPHNPKQKKLQHMKNGEKIKGAPENFLFLTNNCWYSAAASTLIAEDKNGPMYPRDTTDKMKLDTDLNSVVLRLLRGKAGASGLPMEIVISQSEGILPSLTEFHYMRGVKEHGTDKRWGFSGNMQNYELDLLPGEKLSRTAIRGKIDGNSKLRRALNISSEICQMNQLWHNMDDVMCTPLELYNDLKAKGYDWDVLLNTRGWWCIENDDPKHAQPFLSSLDFLNMRAGTYHPYWLEDDKKTLKKAYQK